MQWILLYYKYVDLSSCRDEVVAWIHDLCDRLNLKGRIRVAKDGVNVTVRFNIWRHTHAVSCACYTLQSCSTVPAMRSLRWAACDAQPASHPLCKHLQLACWTPAVAIDPKAIHVVLILFPSSEQVLDESGWSDARAPACESCLGQRSAGT
jgi:hypothetical protein